MENGNVLAGQRTSLGQILSGSRVPLLVLAGGVGLGLGYWGWSNRQSPWGAIGVGAGGSMIAASVLLLLDELL